MKRIKEFLQTRLEATKKNQKGFSLVELIIVIAILGIIAGIALPNVTKSLNDSKKQADITNAKAIANAIAILEADQTNGSDVPASTNGETYVVLTLKITSQLNGVAPIPKRESGKEFVVSIDNSTGAIAVGVATVTNSIVGTVTKIYPVADSPSSWS